MNTDKYMDIKLRKIMSQKLYTEKLYTDEDKLNSIDFKIVESFVRKKKLENINSKN